MTGPAALPTPNDLADELGTTGVQVRNFLRQRFPRSSAEFHSKWVLTEEQIAVVRQELRQT